MKLYKYRKFSEFLISELCESRIYFSPPQDFNDPLDCSPVVFDDIGKDQLENLCYSMMVQAKDHDFAREQLGVIQESVYSDIEEQRPEQQYLFQLQTKIKRLLDEKLNGWGVLSLSATRKSTLMWSHYADEHKGVCLEFDMSSAKLAPKEIDYQTGRGIKASLIKKFIETDSLELKNEIEQQYFFSKAPGWKYESEWRLVQEKSGPFPFPFKLTGVYFGIRCKNSVKNAIMKILYSKSCDIKFIEMYTDYSTFELHERELEPEEHINSIPRESGILAFPPVSMTPPSKM